MESLRARRVDVDEDGNRVEMFLVRWKGWTCDDDTWEPRENIVDTECIEDFFRQREAEQARKREAELKKGAAAAHGRSLVRN